MPPKRSSKSSKAAGSPSSKQLTERSTAELKTLADQAKKDGSITSLAVPYVRAGLALQLLGIFSNVTVMALSPVYGDIPSSIYHGQLIIAGCFVGWSCNMALRQILDRFSIKTPQLLPVAAIYVPLIQFLMFPFSGSLGPRIGPVVTEALTLVPVTVLTAASVADYLDGVPGPSMGNVPAFITDAAPGLTSWAVFRASEFLTARVLRDYIGKSILFTRVVMQTLVAAGYTMLAPSRWLMLAAPALLHTALLNTHAMTPAATTALNATMAAQQWVLLDRRESVTGYVSVLESLERGFRVMRCDHSLLGGQWTVLQGMQVSEPIYGVFAMLEAVRLVESRDVVADQDANALVVGLGIGTTPSALVAHGINTTVVEIDPVVHEFAARYFDLKENNEPAIADAIRYTKKLVREERTFDYIVHDVFTGGAEPVNLFTLEFLTRLYTLLSPEGVIAINYAGDFSLPAPQIIVRTITQVFPTCRIFRESPTKEDRVEGDADFTNMVIFCQKKETAALRFRPAVAGDFLQSRARQMFLQPKHEVMLRDILDGESQGILRSNETDKMTSWHQESAKGHWVIMRTVLPAWIWEMW